MSKGKSLFLGFLAGSSLAVAATLLTTPASGRDMRNRVKGQGAEWKVLVNNLKEDSQRLKDQLFKTSKEGSILVKDLTQEMKKTVMDWKETVEPHQENIHNYLAQIETSLKELEEKVKSQ
ncbi:YtxH domain-containing protein [Virgibacillus sp. YIM 98842]|jgi:gas vesicle protein|uniref:YtxH domain-containing protein n=1 Tax=Virgibacillus sp. YIM 98842 TaxID=2663533 RepID=UPI0013DB5E62|nr:YtxH domain-containing protein [Virgibacillus sp. YIM 98842]